jgi:DNA-binding beta-propeller fold protein YncE
MRFLILAVLALATPVRAQEIAALPTQGHPFAALPLPGAVIVTVTANGRPDSATGLRVFTGTSPAALKFDCFQAVDAKQVHAIAISADRNTLVVAAGDAGLQLFSRAAVIDGCHARPVTVSLGSAASRQGSIDVTISPDGRYAFVANEYGVVSTDAAGHDLRGHVAIVALSYDDKGAPTGGRVVGRVATGAAAVTSVVLSRDGRRLYVTSEVARPGARLANATVPKLAHGGCRQGDGPAQPFGLLSVIDVARAEAGDARSVISATAAGCSPVRAAVSPDGQTVWVAARGDDKVLAFSTDRLEADPAQAFLGESDSGGQAPVGLAVFAGGKRLAVANSNRFGGATATGNLALLDAVPSAPKLTASIPATHFPRSVSVGDDGQTLFLTDYNGGQVQVVLAN